MAIETLKLDDKRAVEILYPDELMAEKPVIILAHGSGNDMQSPFLETITEQLEYKGLNVIRFNFPYKVAGKKFPDRSEILENSWRLVIRFVLENLQFKSLYIGGKSMGGRIATIIAGDFPEIKGLIFLGYPLHPPGKFDNIRDEFLYLLSVPMLFIQGTRDPFARMDLLQQTLSHLRNRATLHWIEGGEHSFKVLVRSGHNYPDILKRVAGIVADWIDEVEQKK